MDKKKVNYYPSKEISRLAKLSLKIRREKKEKFNKNKLGEVL